jgi:hypothetical protein
VLLSGHLAPLPPGRPRPRPGPCKQELEAMRWGGWAGGGRGGKGAHEAKGKETHQERKKSVSESRGGAPLRRKLKNVISVPPRHVGRRCALP